VGGDDPGGVAAARRARARGTGAIGYLHDLRDGQTWYRNDVAEPSTVDPADRGEYVVSAWGLPVARYRLDQDGASPVLRPGSGPALRLAPIEAGRFLSSTGEVLDLTGPTPSYANIPLTRC
jgi:hypothetical protein